MDTSTWDVDALFDLQYASCNELGAAKAELAQLQSSEVVQRYETFNRLNDGTRSITQIREEVTHAVAMTQKDTILLQGEIAQLEATLRWVEARIAYTQSCGADTDGQE